MTATQEAINVERLETYPARTEMHTPVRQEAPDFRPDAAEIVLQLNQIPENSSRELNELHDLHILSKEMRRVLREHFTGIFDTYKSRIIDMEKLYSEVNPAIETRVALAESMVAKIETLAETHYKELFVISILRADLEKLIQPNKRRNAQLQSAENTILEKSKEFKEAGSTRNSLVEQRGQAERRKYAITENGEDAPATDVSQLDIAIDRLTSLIDQNALDSTALHEEINILNDSKYKLSTKIAETDLEIGAIWRNIDKCFAVIQQNLKQLRKIQDVGLFLKEDIKNILTTADVMKKEANELREKHESALNSEDYTVTSYFEADSTAVREVLSDNKEDLAQKQEDLNQVNFVKSGLYESHLDDSTMRSVQHRIDTDFYVRLGEETSSEPKKLALRQMPTDLQHTEPTFYAAVRTAYMQLIEIRRHAINYQEYPLRYSNTVYTRVKDAVNANGFLLKAQQTEYGSQAHGIDACIEHADSLLSDTKPIQLQFDQVTETYTSFRARQDPVVEGLATRTRDNNQSALDERNREARLAETQATLEESIAFYESELQNIVKEERSRLVNENAAQIEQLSAEAQHNIQAYEALMSEAYAYGQPVSDKATELEAYRLIADKKFAASSNLDQTKLDLERAKTNLAALEAEGIQLREKLKEEREIWQREVTRYNAFAKVTRSQIAQSRTISVQELATATEWFNKHGVNIVIDKEAIRAHAAEAKKKEAAAYVPHDFRPQTQHREEREQSKLRRKLGAFLGNMSLRLSTYKN